MAIGERIRFIRNLRGMTQKWLGMAIGFDKRTADVRVAQYEAGTRTPKGNLVESIARALDIRPQALTVPDIDTYIGLMHTFFALEDMYGFEPDICDNQLCIVLKQHTDNQSVVDNLQLWYKEAQKLRKGKITKEDYDAWRYTFPKMEAERSRAQLDAIRAKRNAHPGEEK
ncbi:helix-turn-helix domain-containing protein [Ethanoligenens harbinense]|uniref:Helix-turn-helix domain protein n=1 Tax=Ethanoligenens harbinense (strain DSM 18485 / JCM 12961 / CGMCC 1.5033 / YUAN-3) TaxID=663278 RepID=E6U971_ETHHY|nr:helix-turn-helix transcriptional regulator [Ethanoligenens harbinense]ADU27230.1 helix-turn-helix domain protein [Ethanoligenens harbinense YUAN-3]AVQ96298.1 XRE family transcriptional regulator [Ethanoligenens harbinense YUAN-3]AYF38957.1 XRE family transcriptional regulator [Ethanoligenens harbinense]AYF41709.1 XRE family transcriptional regulator [Ethanoligenens harbinense]QCN92539.1 XRE family transcriptional regulator [Ethanoligenens harbinense]